MWLSSICIISKSSDEIRKRQKYQAISHSKVFTFIDIVIAKFSKKIKDNLLQHLKVEMQHRIMCLSMHHLS
jgi:hypothetical protein